MQFELEVALLYRTPCVFATLVAKGEEGANHLLARAAADFMTIDIIMQNASANPNCMRKTVEPFTARISGDTILLRSLHTLDATPLKVDGCL